MNRFYISLFFLFMAMTSFAQEQISGIVVGDNCKPIEFATILQLSADSTAIDEGPVQRIARSGSSHSGNAVNKVGGIHIFLGPSRVS